MSSRCSSFSIPISIRFASSILLKSVSTSNPLILNIPAYCVNPSGSRNFPIPKSFMTSAFPFCWVSSRSTAALQMIIYAWLLAANFFSIVSFYPFRKRVYYQTDVNENVLVSLLLPFMFFLRQLVGWGADRAFFLG